MNERKMKALKLRVIRLFANWKEPHEDRTYNESDIVQEIDKIDDNYSIVSNISNKLSQSMRHKLNNKMKSEYKFSCKKCGYQTISFSWQCPTCKSWESSSSINFLKAI